MRLDAGDVRRGRNTPPQRPARAPHDLMTADNQGDHMPMHLLIAGGRNRSDRSA